MQYSLPYFTRADDGLITDTIVSNTVIHIIIEEQMRGQKILFDSLADIHSTTPLKDRRRYLVLALYINSGEVGSVDPNGGDFDLTLEFLGWVKSDGTRNSLIRNYKFFASKDLTTDPFYINTEIVICFTPYNCSVNTDLAILFDSYDSYRLSDLERRVLALETPRNLN